MGDNQITEHVDEDLALELFLKYFTYPNYSSSARAIAGIYEEGWEACIDNIGKERNNQTALDQAADNRAEGS